MKVERSLLAITHVTKTPSSEGVGVGTDMCLPYPASGDSRGGTGAKTDHQLLLSKMQFYGIL